MGTRGLPPPEALRNGPPKKHSPITFRLDPEDLTKLHGLAERAGIGHTSLVRRIVEHYIREHATPTKGKRGTK